MAFSHWHSTRLLSLLPPPHFQLPGTHGYFSPPFHHPKEGFIPLGWLKQDALPPHRFCKSLWIQLLQPEVATEPRIIMILHQLKYLDIISQILVAVMVSLHQFSSFW